MRRFWLLLLGIAVFTNGCSSGSSAKPITTAAPSPATEVKAAGSIFDSQFHPCEVLTDAQFQKAGLGDRFEGAAELGSLAKGCSFKSSNPLSDTSVWLVSTDNVSRKYIESKQLEVIDWGTETNPEMYVHEVSKNIRQCEVAVDYSWGRFTVNYFEGGEGWEPSVLCPEAGQILGRLIDEIGEIDDIET